MSDKQMYDILGKFNNIEPKLTQVTENTINQSVKETVDPASLKGRIQQLEEKYMGFDKTVAAIKKGGSAENPEAVAAAIGRKKYGKEKFQKAAAAGKKLGEGSKQRLPIVMYKEISPDMLRGRHFYQVVQSQSPFWKVGETFSDDDMSMGSRQVRFISDTGKEQGVAEGSKPDFLDVDKDGDKKEPMKKAAKDAKKVTEGKMKDLSMDLKELSEAEFKKKYGKTKAEMRKSLAEAREMKDKDEFDDHAKVGDYYYTKTGGKVIKTSRGYKHEQGQRKDKDEDKDDLNEFFYYDAPKGKDRGPRDRGHDELERRAGLGKNPLVKHGKEYKSMKRNPGGEIAKAHAIAGPKGKLPESTMTEKAKSKAQQKFMGMVYAAKKGEKAPSAAVAKAAKGMSKKAAHDFAKTKHKNLPQHVNEVDMGQADSSLRRTTSSKEQQEKIFANHRERIKKLSDEPQKSTKKSVKMNESQDIRKHPIYTTQEAWDHYSRELAEQEMSAMEADMAMEEPLMDADHELDEIARLAGLPPLPKEINVDMDKLPPKSNGLVKPVVHPNAPPEEVPAVLESGCNMTAEGEMCPEHGLAECGMYDEDIYDEGNEFSGALANARATGAKEFEVDGREYPVRETEEMDEGNEFTKARLDAIKAGKDSFVVGGKSYSVTGDTSGETTLEEGLSVNINATDEDVVSLMQRLAGLPTVAVATAPAESSCGCEEALEEERDIEWDNTPEEQVAPISAAIPNGTGMHRSKMQDPHTANRAANPLAETEDRLWKNYERMLNAIKD